MMFDDGVYMYTHAWNSKTDINEMKSVQSVDTFEIINIDIFQLIKELFKDKYLNIVEEKKKENLTKATESLKSK